jgi:hypothetical protein
MFINHYADSFQPDCNKSGTLEYIELNTIKLTTQ